MFEKICADLENCQDSTRLVCIRNGISVDLFKKYLIAFPENITRYTRAKSEQAEFLLDEIHTLESEMDVQIKGNDPKIANAIATSYRLKIDNIKWILSKLKPKKYGDKMEIDGKVVPESVLIMKDSGTDLFELKAQQKEVKNEQTPGQ